MYDIRDNKPYTVRKLADGNCWMTEDLELDLSTSSTTISVFRARSDSTTVESWTPSWNGGYNSDVPLNSNTRTPDASGNYYYNFYDVTAGSGTSGQANTSADWSICPAGWQVPLNYTLSNTKSYGSLTDAYGLTVNGANNTNTNISVFEGVPFNFARKGYYYNGGRYTNGPQGTLWSNTAYSNSIYAYHFSYDSNNTWPQNYAVKNLAMPVRCVAL